MLITISPAKTLDYDSAFKAPQQTKPRMLDRSQELINNMRQMSSLDISELMKVSSKIAELNFRRFHDWSTPFTRDNARPSIFAFKGDVYTGLDIDTFEQDDLKYAQQHLRILSGLYGVLRPLDLMQAYRLEMGTRLKTDAGKNLYEFWGDEITRLLNKDLKQSGSNILVNLASNAKKARGLMSRFILLNRIDDPEKIKTFNVDGYMFSDPMSTDTEWVFTRAQ